MVFIKLFSAMSISPKSMFLLPYLKKKYSYLITVQSTTYFALYMLIWKYSRITSRVLKQELDYPWPVGSN